MTIRTFMTLVEQMQINEATPMDGFTIDIFANQNGADVVQRLRDLRKTLAKRHGKDALIDQSTFFVPANDFKTVEQIIAQFPKCWVKSSDNKTIYWSEVGWYPIFTGDGGYRVNDEKNAEMGFVKQPTKRVIHRPHMSRTD